MKDLCAESTHEPGADHAEQTMQQVAQPAIRTGSLFNLLHTSADQTDRIIQTIERDPVLAARVLSVVNSAALGVTQQITCVSRAVHLLGAGRAKSIGLAHGLRLLGEAANLPEPLRDALWIGSVTKACAASLFMQHTDAGMAENAFAHALIQDIGLPMLAHVDPQWYLDHLLDGPTDARWTDAERQRFGLDHAAVGETLLREWEAPADLIAHVQTHHASLGQLPAGDDEALMEVAVFMAGLLPHAWETPSEWQRNWLGAIHARFLADRFATPEAFVLAASEAARHISGRERRVSEADHQLLRRALLLGAGEDMIATISNLCRIESRLLEQRSRFADLRLEAFTDSLTHVLNRRGFNGMGNRRMNTARQQSHSACCMMVDVDDLKIINDTHGHLAGDKALRNVGRLLRRSVRKADLIGRLGGDEFAILITDVTPVEAARCANVIARAFEHQRLVIGDAMIDLHVSVGAVFVERLTAELRIEHILHAADDRMYQIKRNRKMGTYDGTVAIAPLKALPTDHHAA